MKLQEVHVHALTPERLSPLIGPERTERFHKFAGAARDMLSGRVVRQRQLHADRRGRRRDAADAPRLRARSRRRHPMVRHQRRPAVSSRSRSASTTTSTVLSVTAARSVQRSARHYEDDPARQRRGAAHAGAVRATSSCSTIRRPPACAADLARGGATVVWRCHVGSDTANDHVERGVGVPATLPRAMSTPTCSRARRSRLRGPTPSTCS